MNKFEHYEPSEEEMKNAEDMMGPKKAELSALRERSAQLLKEKGVDGYLETDGNGGISGKINGHEIILKVGIAESKIEGVTESGWQGNVDGYNLTSEETRRFMEKYRDIWARYGEGTMEAAAKEKVTPGKAEVLKDIGL